MDYMIAFLAGILFTQFLHTYPVRVMIWKTKNLVPRRCPVCGKWYPTEKLLYAKHRTAGFVRICKSCWDDQYMPFSKNKE